MNLKNDNDEMTPNISHDAKMPSHQAVPPSTTNDVEMDITFRDVDYKVDFDSIPLLLINAFEDQIQYRQVTNTTGRPHWNCLLWIFQRRILMHERFKEKTSLIVGCSGDRVVAAAGIIPHAVQPNLWDYIITGMLMYPYIFCTIHLKSLYKWTMSMLVKKAATVTTVVKEKENGIVPDPPGGKIIKEKEKESKKDPKGGKVVFVAIHKTLQGNGIGGKLLEKIIYEWDSRDGGDLVLSTMTERSLKFYMKYGFEIVNMTPKEGYSNYSMIRRKQKTKTSSVQ